MTINNKLHGETQIAPGGTFDAHGVCTFHEPVTIDGTTTVNGDVTNAGAVTMDGAVTVNGALTQAGDVTNTGDTTIDGALYDNGLPTAPESTGVTLTDMATPYRRARINLTGVVVPVTAALDFGSVLIATFPNSNILLLGAVMDLAAVEDGVGITVPEAVDFALGSVPLASVDFSNGGEQDVIAEGDVSAAGVMEGVSSDTEDSQFLAAAADNEIYVNVQATISTDGDVTLDGFVDLVYVDLGAPDGV